MKRALLILLFAAPIFPQTVPFSPVPWMDHTDGVSVEAMGRGGASIAIADDLAGVWSNPAGIAAIRNPEGALGLEGIRARVGTRESMDSTTGDSGASGRAYTQNDRAAGNLYNLGYAAAAKPINVGEREFVFWAGYRPMADFPGMTRTWSLVNETLDASGQAANRTVTSYRSDTSYSDLTPSDWGIAAAAHLSPRLNFGIHLHYLQARVLAQQTEMLPAADQNQISLNYQYAGLLWDAGIQYDAGKGVHFGAVYKSGMKAGMDYRVDQISAVGSAAPIADHAHLRWPDAWGLGAAWRIVPRLRLALDYGRTDWAEARIDHFGYGVSTAADYPTFYPGQQDTSSWRFGAEYQLPSPKNAVWTVRAGYRRDEQNIVPPFMLVSAAGANQPILKSVTAGAGLTLPKIRFDAAYVHVSAEDADNPSTRANPSTHGGGFRLAEDQLLLSATVQLKQ